LAENVLHVSDYQSFLLLILSQISSIKEYAGDKQKLGNAEKFYLVLSGLA
jgi:hypothetical protein